MPSPFTPAEPLGACVARFPRGGSLPRKSDGSASALEFSRPPRRSLDYGLPARGVTCMTLSIVGFDGFVAFTIAAIATGWSDPYRVGLPPTGKPCLCTAHGLSPPILSPAFLAHSARVMSTRRQRQATGSVLPRIADDIGRTVERGVRPSRPGDFHPEPLTEPNVSLPAYSARATASPHISHHCSVSSRRLSLWVRVEDFWRRACRVVAALVGGFRVGAVSFCG